MGNNQLKHLKWVPIFQGFHYFWGFLHHSVLAKLSTSSIRVKSGPVHYDFASQLTVERSQNQKYPEDGLMLQKLWCAS